MSLEAIKQVTETEQSIQTRRAAAEAESARQRQQAEARLETAAEFIVERVVKH